MIRSRPAAVIAVTLLAACHARDLSRPQSPAAYSQRSADAKRFFQLSPPDLTTSAENSEIAVWAEIPGQIPMSYLTDVAARISLVTWPEDKPVAWQASFYVASSSRASNRFSRVIVQPQVALSPRWYALKVAKLPDWMGLRTMTATVDTTTTGDTMVRFRHGSDPHVVAIDQIQRASDQEFPYLIVVDLSEAISTANAVAAIALTESAALACQAAPTYGALSSSVAFRCRSSTLENLGVTVTRFPSADGTASLSATSDTIQVDSGKIVAFGSGIKRYNVDPFVR